MVRNENVFLLCCLPFKPMIPHLLCYQGLAVDDYSSGLDALDLRYPRLL
jgi:hypothetical protein